MSPDAPTPASSANPVPRTSGTSPSGAADTGPAFYLPPAPLPFAPAGTLVRDQPAATPVGRAWRILYHSRGLDGQDVAVSGAVVVPDAPPPPGGYPLVAWGHATTGLADGCAPSHGVPGWFSRFLVAHGYAVAITDDEGLGTPGLHHFAVGRELGQAMLDSVRAARRLVPVDAGRIAVAGWSQGGNAALWAGVLAREYSPELSLTGVVAVAPASDLPRLLPDQNGGPWTGYAVLAVVGLADAYPGASLDDVLTPAARARRTLVTSACAPAVVRAFADRPALDTAALARPPWADILEANVPRPTGPTPPILIVLGDRDSVVTPAATRALLPDLCRFGTAVHAHHDPGADHGSVLARGESLIAAWIADRIGRRTGVASDC